MRDVTTRLSEIRLKLQNEDRAAEKLRAARAQMTVLKDDFVRSVVDQADWLNERLSETGRRLHVSQAADSSTKDRLVSVTVLYREQDTGVAFFIEIQTEPRLVCTVKDHDGVVQSKAEGKLPGSESILDLLFRLIERPIPVDRFCIEVGREVFF